MYFNQAETSASPPAPARGRPGMPALQGPPQNPFLPPRFPSGGGPPGGLFAEPIRAPDSARERSSTPMKGSLMERVGAVLESGGSSSSTARAQPRASQAPMMGSWGGVVQQSNLGPRIQGIFPPQNGGPQQQWRSSTPSPGHPDLLAGTPPRGAPMSNVFGPSMGPVVGAQCRSTSWGGSSDRGRGLGFQDPTSPQALKVSSSLGPSFSAAYRSNSAQPAAYTTAIGTSPGRALIGSSSAGDFRPTVPAERSLDGGRRILGQPVWNTPQQAPPAGPLFGAANPQRYGPLLVPDTNGIARRYTVAGPGQVGNVVVRSASAHSQSPSPQRQVPQRVICQSAHSGYQFQPSQPQQQPIQVQRQPTPQKWQILHPPGAQYMQKQQQQQQQQQQIHQLTAQTQTQLRNGPQVLQEAKFRRQLYNLRFALDKWPSPLTKQAIRTAATAGACATKPPEDWDAEDAKLFVSKLLAAHSIDPCLCSTEEDDLAWQAVLRGEFSAAAYGAGELPEALAHCAVGRAVKELEKIVEKFSQHLPPCSAKAPVNSDGGQSLATGQNSISTSPLTTNATAPAATAPATAMSTTPMAAAATATATAATTTATATRAQAVAPSSTTATTTKTAAEQPLNPHVTLPPPPTTTSGLGELATTLATTANNNNNNNNNNKQQQTATTTTHNNQQEQATTLTTVAQKATTAASMSRIPLPMEVENAAEPATDFEGSNGHRPKGGALTETQRNFLESWTHSGNIAESTMDSADGEKCESLRIAAGLDSELLRMRNELNSEQLEREALSSRVEALFQARSSPGPPHGSMEVSDTSWLADPVLHGREGESQNLTLNMTSLSEALSEFERNRDEEETTLPRDEVQHMEPGDGNFEDPGLGTAKSATLNSEYSPQKTLPSAPSKTRTCPNSLDSGKNIMPSPIPTTEASPYGPLLHGQSSSGNMTAAPELPGLRRHQQDQRGTAGSEGKPPSGASDARGEPYIPPSARSNQSNGEVDSISYYRDKCLELSSQVHRQDNEIVSLRRALHEARAQAAAAAASSSCSSSSAMR